MSHPTLPTVKRGDTFLLACTYREAGVATDLTGYDVQAQIRDSLDALVEQLVVALADQGVSPGVFTLAPIQNPPTDWPIDLLRCDVQFSLGGVVRSTETFLVPVDIDVTRAV